MIFFFFLYSSEEIYGSLFECVLNSNVEGFICPILHFTNSGIRIKMTLTKNILSEFICERDLRRYGLPIAANSPNLGNPIFHFF